MNNTKKLQDEKVKSLAKKYSDEGFDILIKPKTDQLPFNLDNYQPDILATKNEGESGLIIDVKTTTNRGSIDILQSALKEIRRHPGWRFLLVTLEDIEADLLPLAPEQLPSWDELIDSFSQAYGVIKNNEIESVFLAFWNIFERALIKKAVDLSIPVEHWSSIRLVRSIYSLGELSISQFDMIQAYIEKRNHLAKGYIKKLNWDVLFTFVNFLGNLLEEWTPDISISQRRGILSILVQVMASMAEKTTAEKHRTLVENVTSLLHDETKEKQDEILARIKQAYEQEGLPNFFNDLQHLVSESYDPDLEFNNEELNKNQLVLRDKA
ncbi:hypothetical protein VB711_11295 [Cronbergia sp. UHCC 0137]|uniref:hypothetical protein n=1 Tax=Cronbergia sp. UHCC 0137 TaxID=3110239 RepID=UPI002B218B9E|nr:hypothetical protein [Cronbergia sp. UHCC 0137]MEA5618419.1 hypothetical protein [Cronbergia sp. UHCC 0137]